MTDEIEKRREERRLIARCASGDSDAWDRFIERYGALIYAVIMKYELGIQRSRELFSHVVEHLWLHDARRLVAWRERAKFSTYLGTITSRLCADYLKSRFYKEGARYDSLEDYERRGGGTRAYARSTAGPVRRLLQAESESMLNGLLSLLSEEENALAKLFYWQGRRYREIAVLMGLSVSDVGKKLCQVRSKLREMLAKRGVEKVSDLWE